MKLTKVNSLREVDKLVAEHIFGWDLFTHRELGYKLTGEYGGERKEVPYYSTDIKAAWEILYYFGEFSIEYSTLNKYTKVSILDKHYNQNRIVELAICLAALKTRDIEVELDL